MRPLLLTAPAQGATLDEARAKLVAPAKAKPSALALLAAALLTACAGVAAAAAVILGDPARDLRPVDQPTMLRAPIAGLATPRG